MKKVETKKSRIIWLVIALVVVLVGGVLFIGAVSGWFNSKVTIDTEYYSENPKMIDLNAAEFENLINNKKSFIVFVDQTGCTTADRVREYITNYSQENKINIYKMMFKDAKESTLHNYVKYYPSVVVVDKGKVRIYLRADSDEDADEYNDYYIFKAWLDDVI